MTILLKLNLYHGIFQATNSPDLCLGIMTFLKHKTCKGRSSSFKSTRSAGYYCLIDLSRSLSSGDGFIHLWRFEGLVTASPSVKSPSLLLCSGFTWIPLIPTPKVLYFPGCFVLILFIFLSF